MKNDHQSAIMRRSVALPQKLVDQAKAVAPVEIKENFNRLVILALEDFAARRRRKSFEEAMDQMGSDQEIRKECRAINRDFQKAEGDGLSDGD